MGKSSGNNYLIYLGVAVVVVALAMAYYMNGKFNQHEQAIVQLEQNLAALNEKTNNSVGLISNNIDAIRDDLNCKINRLEHQLAQLRRMRMSSGNGNANVPRRNDYEDDDLLSSRFDN